MPQTLTSAMRGTSLAFCNSKLSMPDILRNKAIYEACQKTFVGILAKEKANLKTLLAQLDEMLEPENIPKIGEDANWQNQIIQIIISIGEAHTQLQNTIWQNK